MKFVISYFGGIMPRLSEHALAPQQATIAHNVKLANGRLEPWRDTLVFTETCKNAASFYMRGCCVFSWPKHVMCAEISPDWNTIYLTGRNGFECAEINGCELSYSKMGVPAPTHALVANASEDCGEEADAHAYVYTYVNKWGDESAPSPPSSIVRVNDGGQVSFPAGVPDPPEGYAIVEARLYRTATGFRPPDGKVQTPLTDYLYVGAVDVPGCVTTVDVLAGKYLGAALDTLDNHMPPENPGGVVAVPDQARLAAFKGNRIYLSEAFSPHNWPVKNELTLDENVVHMLALDQRLFVTTSGRPYIIDVGQCDDTKCVPVTKIDVEVPDIACRYPHSAIMTRHGMIYASRSGLVLLQPNGEWHILTAKWFDADEWMKIKPSTIRMAYWEEYLFFATDEATFLLNINGGAFGDMKGAELATMSDRPIDMLVSGTGALMLLEEDNILEWNASPHYRFYTWESRPLTSADATGISQPDSASPARGSMWWPTSAKCGGYARFILKNPRNAYVFDRYLSQDKVCRLPRRGRHLWYKVRLESNDKIDFFDMGTSIFTVNSGS